MKGKQKTEGQRTKRVVKKARPKSPKAPKSPTELSAYRCRLNCAVGKDVLCGSVPTPKGVTRVEYAMVFLLASVMRLLEFIEKKEGGQ